MKFFLLLLLLCGLFACNINQSDFLYNNTVSVQPRKSTPITSISEIEATGLKDFNNREIKYVYKIFVDSSSNQEILLKKMYQLQRKIKFPFTRPLREPKNGRYAFVMENDVSVFDRLSQTIIGLKEDSSISVFLIGSPCMMQSMPSKFINLDYYYFSCSLDSTQSASKSIAMMVESFPSKQKADSMLAIVKTVAKNAYLIKQPESIEYVNN